MFIRFFYAVLLSVHFISALCASDKSPVHYIDGDGNKIALKPWQELTSYHKPEVVTPTCTQRVYAAMCNGYSQLVGRPRIPIHPSDMYSLKVLMAGIESEIDYHEDVSRCVVGTRELVEVISEVESHVVTLSSAEEPIIADSASKQFLGSDILLCYLLQAVRRQSQSSWLEHASITYKEMRDGIELARMLLWRLAHAFSKTRSLKPIQFEEDKSIRSFDIESILIAGRGHEDCVVNGRSVGGHIYVARAIADLSENDVLFDAPVPMIPDASWVIVCDGHKVDPRWKKSVRIPFAGFRCQNKLVLWASERLNALLVEKLALHDEDPLRTACEDLRSELSSVYEEDWFAGTTITAFLNHNGRFYFAQLGDSGFFVATPQGYLFSGMHRLSNPREKEHVAKKMVKSEYADLVDYKEGRIAGLSVTRTFGDLWHPAVGKSHDALVRDNFEYTVLPADMTIKAIIIASDGLWDELSPDSIAFLLQDEIREKSCAADMVSLIRHQLDCLLPQRYQDRDDVACVVIAPEIE